MIIQFICRAILLGVPLLYGSTGEIVTEKSGHLNLGIPGVMYVGAISGVVGSFLYENACGNNIDNMNAFLAVIIPLLCSVAGAVIMGLIYSFLTVTLHANQNVTGLALTTLGIGLGNFLGASLINITNSELPSIALTKTSSFFSAKLPFADDLGWFGELFFSHDFMTYLAIAIALVVSVFHALYQAGGVNEIGTLRAIKVFRGNSKIVTLDVYDYLLNGKTGDDVRLEDGDVITVDTYNCLVNVEGKVKRPMYYEMKPTETVADLLRYSGGFTRDAYRGDVRIERMGVRERQIFTLDDNEQKNFAVRDGDVMSVDSIRDTYENLVEAKGAFFRPGKFQCGGEISTVKQLIEKAGGLRPEAFTNRALLNRRLPDMTMENLSIDIKGIMAGTAKDVELRPNDVLYVQTLEDVEEVKMLMIYGEVAFPGKYRFAENTTVEDLILLAGGLNDKASTVKVEVARRTRDSEATVSGDTLAEIFTFAIDKGLVVSGDPEFVLKPYDAVYVRRSPRYYEQQNVIVSGEVEFAGTYVLDRKGIRLSDIIKNAGGLTNKAYIKGARLERKMTAEQRARMLDALKTVQKQMDSLDISEIDIKPVMQVGIELDKAIAEPGSDADIVLEDGDRLIVPQITNTVKVDGNVMFPNAVAYKEGAKLKHYIEQAGGYGMNAKKSKAIVVYMNGTVAEASNKKDLIQPGCQIIVPTKLARKGMSTSEILSLSSTSASLATVVLALINLLK